MAGERVMVVSRGLVRGSIAALLVAALAMGGCGAESFGKKKAKGPSGKTAPYSRAAGLNPPVDLVLSSAKTSYSVGALVTIDVSLANTTPAFGLYGAGADLSYDPAVLDLVGIDISGGLLSAGTPIHALRNGQAGQLVWAVSKKGAQPGASGAGAVAHIVFTAKAPGNAALALSDATLLDDRGAPIPANLRTAPAIQVK